jgi:hypothetical protein
MIAADHASSGFTMTDRRSESVTSPGFAPFGFFTSPARVYVTETLPEAFPLL